METNESPSELEERETNYKGFFVIGIVFLVAGTALATAANAGMCGLTTMGLLFIAIGFANRDKW